MDMEKKKFDPNSNQPDLLSLYPVYVWPIGENRYWKYGIKYPMKMLNTSKLFFLLLPLYYLVTLPCILPHDVARFYYRQLKKEQD